MAEELVENAKKKMQQSLENLERNLGQIRAGRANASLLDRVMVNYYGAATPLNQLASITIPEARVLMISPYDKSSLKDIETAINMSDLGLNPANDGNFIRLVIPMLTEERRKELVKEMGKFVEEAKVSVRNARRDAIDTAKKQQKANELTEDDVKDLEKEIQKATDEAIKKLDKASADKETELITV